MKFKQILVPASLVVNASAACVPNPAFPLPSLSPNSPQLKPLQNLLNEAINSLLESVTDPSSNQDLSKIANVTSFSLAVTSGQDTLWQYHHTAKIQYSEGEHKVEDNAKFESNIKHTKVNENTVYRIASITKVFAVAGLLAAERLGKADRNDPVSKWIPELKEAPLHEPHEKIEIEPPDWDSITLAALGSHLSGQIRDYAMFDLSSQAPPGIDFTKWGLPPVSTLPPFPNGTNGPDAGMSWNEYLGRVRQQPSVFPSFFIPTYSNINFGLLGLAIERSTKTKFRDFVHDQILSPLGMTQSSFDPPTVPPGIIPNVPDNSWFWSVNSSVHINDAAGGLYCSTRDLLLFLRAILSYEMFPGPVTRSWLKPVAFMQGSKSAIGLPFEILRTDRGTKDGRALDVYTKAGGLIGYYSRIGIIPELDVGFSIMIASEYIAPLNVLTNVIATTLVQKVDEIARRQAEQTYTGHFRARDINSSIEVHIDPGTGALAVKRWVSNDTDFLNDSLPRIVNWPPFKNEATMEGNIARLLPTGTHRRRAVSEGIVEEGEVWKVLIADDGQPKPKKEGGLWDDFCMNDVDWRNYGGLPLSEIVFWKSKSGKVKSVGIRALDVELYRHDTLPFGLGKLEEMVPQQQIFSSVIGSLRKLWS